MTLANLSRFGSALFAALVVPDTLLLLGCGLYIGDLDALICCYLDFQLLDYDPLSSNFWLAITICQALHSCVAWGAGTPLSERPSLRRLRHKVTGLQGIYARVAALVDSRV